MIVSMPVATEKEYTYTDECGNHLCTVKRRDNPLTQKKSYTQWTYNNDGQLLPKGLPSDVPKPIYNLAGLLAQKDKPLLIVEGEKAADAGITLFPEFAVITWLGGSGTASKADCTHLANRDIYLLPDNDSPGYKAMNLLKERLLSIANKIYFVDIQTIKLSKGWDIADLLKEAGEITLEDIKILIHDTRPYLSTPTNSVFPDMQGKKLINTEDNLKHLLAIHGIKVAHNMMTRRNEYSGLAKNLKYENYYAKILSECSRYKLSSHKIDAFLESIATQNAYHPVRDWIEVKKWDGKNRFNELLDTIDTNARGITEVLLYKWMVSAIAALYSENGLSLHGVLVFQGAQGSGKTSWFKSISPQAFHKDGVIFDVNNKDSLIHVTSSWLVELGEIDSTYKKSDMEALKAFITRSSDSYRAPYGKYEKIYPRHTAYFGTVDKEKFLVDNAGNRRWWIVSVKDLNFNHGIDLQQLWAEIKYGYDQGQKWYLTTEQFHLLNQQNQEFEMVDTMLERIACTYNFDSHFKSWRSPTQIAIEIGLNNPTRSDATRIGAILKKLNIEQRRDMYGSKFHMPLK